MKMRQKYQTRLVIPEGTASQIADR
jgi:hypothetical protein